MKKLILGALLLLSMVSFGQEKFKTNYCINDDPVIVSALGMTYKLEMEYEVTDSTLTFIQVDKAILKHYQKNNLPLRSTLKVQLVSNNNVGNSNIKVYSSKVFFIKFFCSVFVVLRKKLKHFLNCNKP